MLKTSSHVGIETVDDEHSESIRFNCHLYGRREYARAVAGRKDRRKKVDRQYARNARVGYITGVRVCEPLSPLD